MNTNFSAVSAATVLTKLDQSSLSSSSKQNLATFLHRFPDLLLEAPYKIKDPLTEIYPVWLNEYLSLFSGLTPYKVNSIQFDEMAKVFPNDPNFLDDFWYMYGLTEVLSGEHKKLFYRDLPVHIVADDIKTSCSTLFIITDPSSTDTKVYECCPDHEEKHYGVFAPRKQEGHWDIINAHVAFEDFSELFVHIEKVK